jgi:predicted aspartyl protease
MTLAYPGERSGLSEHIARDMFLAALEDPDMELKIREKEPQTLDEAVKFAQRFEVYKGAVEASSVRHKVNRQVQEEEESTPEDKRGRRKNGARGEEPYTIGQTCAVAHDRDRDWKKEMTAKLEAVLAEQKAADEKTRKLLSANEVLNMEIARLRQLEQLRSASSLPLPIPGEHIQRLPAHPPPTQMICFGCGQPGHFIRRCPQGQGHRGQGQSPAMTSTDPTPFQVNGATSRRRTSNGNRTYLYANVGGCWLDCLLDSGSDITLVPSNLVDPADINRTSQTLRAANGTEIPVKGQIKLPLRVGNYETLVHGLVSDHVKEVMLGIDWLTDNCVIWNFKQGIVTIGKDNFLLRPHPKGETWSRRVVLKEDMIVPPRNQMDVSSDVVFRSWSDVQLNGLWSTQPQLVQDGLYASRTLIPTDRWGPFQSE